MLCALQRAVRLRDGVALAFAFAVASDRERSAHERVGSNNCRSLDEREAKLSASPAEVQPLQSTSAISSTKHLC